MKYKMLVNNKWSQQIVEISDTGDYFDKSLVLWDEREDGILDEGVVVLGGMIRNGDLLEFNQELFDVNLSHENLIKESQRIEHLWQAAHDYEYAAINGSGIGLLTIGVSKALPKSLAVQAWLGSLWDLYYARKADITNFDTDFSVIGIIPYTIPELRNELGL